jgi:NAD(P)-dependent dehydrogenase (short-subunit alcohol dehydrogenase family)
MTVLVGARNPAAGEGAAAQLRKENLDAHFLQLDLDQPATIEAAAKTIATKFQKLDVLINNAAILDAADGPPGTANLASVKRTLDTNFHGTLAVTQAMLPLLRKAEQARIVNLSSGLGSLEMMSDPKRGFDDFHFLGYCASKAALNMLTVQLAFELRKTNIKVNAVSPGYVDTDMNQHKGILTVEQGAAEPVRLALLPADGPTGGFFGEGKRYPW